METWKSMDQREGGSWKPMRAESSDQEDSKMPGKRGRYLLWLEPPIISGRGRWVHFSWWEESFCIRDFISGMQRRQDSHTTATQIWKSAKRRIPCVGDLFHKIGDFEFWKRKLEDLTKTNPQ